MFSRSELEREGESQPNGVGAIRSLGKGPMRSREEVIDFDPPRHMAYVLLSGMPVVDYRGDVELTADGSGTTVLWSVTFRARYPGMGFPLRWLSQWAITGVLRRLLARAEEQGNMQAHRSEL